MPQIAVIAGDGIGSEVLAEGIKVLESVTDDLEFIHLPYGADHYLATGETITPELVTYHGRSPSGDTPRGLERDGPLPVRSLPANAWGFHEMHGNLWEWCGDVYVWEPGDDPPADEKGAPRCMRGGAWTSAAKECRSGFREGYAPSSDGAKYGLRVVRAAGD